MNPVGALNAYILKTFYCTACRTGDRQRVKYWETFKVFGMY